MAGSCQGRSRRRRIAAAASAAVLAAVMLAPADAQTFRCSGSIIDRGAIAAEVLSKCGEPRSRESRTEPIVAGRVNGGTHVVGTITIEEWVYERGPGQFQARLTFEEDQLTRIEFLDRR